MQADRSLSSWGPPVSVLQFRGYKYAEQCLAFNMVLGIQAQVLMPVEQGLLSIETLQIKF